VPNESSPPLLSRRRPLLGLGRAAALALTIAGSLLFSAAAASARPTPATGHPGRALGLIPVHGARLTGRGVAFSLGKAAAKGKGGNKGGSGTSGAVNLLTYHGGQVFTSPPTVHNIYWVPPGYTVAAGYQSVVDGFIENLSADSGKTTNVFYSDTQYTDGTGAHIAAGMSFGGSATVTDPFPASGCTDSALPGSECLTDNQIANEIAATAAAHGWSVSFPNMYNVLLPRNVGSCATYSSGGLEGFCSFASVCAWHHQWGSLYFVVQPYVGMGFGCQSGESPNNNADADSAINTMSHEMNESLTDPAGGSWFDANGNENGDKCAWLFGTPLGGAAGHLYNQLINGAGYFVQAEWSNQSSGCVYSGV
jgi:hypothetical protein